MAAHTLPPEVAEAVFATLQELALAGASPWRQIPIDPAHLQLQHPHRVFLLTDEALSHPGLLASAVAWRCLIQSTPNTKPYTQAIAEVGLNQPRAEVSWAGPLLNATIEIFWRIAKELPTPSVNLLRAPSLAVHAFRLTYPTREAIWPISLTGALLNPLSLSSFRHSLDRAV